MNKLLWRVAGFIFLTVAVFLIIRLLLPPVKNYNSAFVDKLKILQNNKDKRKIVLIGGSSVGWGLMATLIENKTGIKTINIGHHADLGLLDFEAFVRSNLNKDDIIIFAPEWEFYSDPNFHDPGTLDNLISTNFEYGKITGRYQYMLRSIFSKIKISEHFKPVDTASPYVYNCIDTNGDVISQCNKKRQGPVFYKLQHKPIQIGQFPQYFPFLLSNKTIFLFPPTQVRVFNENRDYLQAIQDTLMHYHYNLVDGVADNVYADSLFFNAQYHITCDERIVRTEKLIAYLEKILAK